MSEQFPLCKKAGLKYERNGIMPDGYIQASDVEKLLADAPVVYAPSYNVANAKTVFDKCGEWYKVRIDKAGYTDGSEYHSASAYSARLLCIEPIAKDTAESLLREAVELLEATVKDDMLEQEHDFIERARKLLEQK